MRCVAAATLMALSFAWLSGGAALATPTPTPNGALITSNVVYGTDGGEPLRLDVYRGPTVSADRPVMVLIHGGGWIGGDKSELAPTAAVFARAGYVVFNVDYSLDVATSPAYPREVNDVQKALTWVRAHASKYGGDPNRLGLFGSSAGAYLAAMLGTTADTAASQPVKAVVTLSGPMDIAGLVKDVRVRRQSKCGHKCILRTQGDLDVIQRLTGCPPLRCSAAHLRRVSPIDHVTSNSPPFLILNSKHEVVPSTQATSMAARLRSDGATPELTLLAGSEHAIDYVSRAATTIATFVRMTLPLTAADPGVTGPPVVAAVPNHSHALRRLVALLILVAALAAAIVMLTADRRRNR